MTRDDLTHTKILVVDDDVLVCEVISETLTSAGYSVESIEDGGDAINAIWDHRPALVVLDCALPGRPGMVVLEEIRASPVFHDLPVIMLTGRRSEWHEGVALAAGANRYLRKPFEPRELLITVVKLLNEDGPVTYF